MVKDQLMSEVAATILQHVRTPKGRLTAVSDLSRINRKEFTVRGLAKMKTHRLLRIFYAVQVLATFTESRRMMEEIFNIINNYAENYEEWLFEESETFKG